MIVWAMIPARGGSKSIKYKNLVPVAGVPLLDYGVRATQASGRCVRIICSTEDDRIAARAKTLGVEVDRRPAELAGDDAPVAAVARDMLRRLGGPEGAGLPDILVLTQPTSPFLLPEHVGALLDAMAADPEAATGQTVTPLPHNYHAFSQRVVEGNRVRFRFAEERSRAYNKQRKPKFYKFGNLVAIRPRALLAGADFFDPPSVPVEIPAPYDFDLDAAGDLPVAEALLAGGCIELPHMTRELVKK